MENPGLIRFGIIVVYLSLLLFLGFFASRLFQGTKKDYMLASHSIGPFLLLMSIFGTTMTAFALVGSSGESWKEGIGVYGMLASSSGIIHSLCFFVIGVKLWALGRRYGYTTQIQYFRDRLKTDWIGVIMFPILVGLVIPYLLIGVMAGGTVMNQMTDGAFATKQKQPPKFAKPLASEAAAIAETYKAALKSQANEDHEGVQASLSKAAGQIAGLQGKTLQQLKRPPPTYGALPKWLGSLLICSVVLVYVFFGGMRGTAWANAFQTIVFMILGVVTFCFLAFQLGAKDKAGNGAEPGSGLMAHLKGATEKVTPEIKLKSTIGLWSKIARGASSEKAEEKKAANVLAVKVKPVSAIKEYRTRKEMSFLKFLTYMFVPLSVGMFPHLFQHWLTAKDANSFKTPVICHPIFIMIVWVPCVLIGIWGTTTAYAGSPNGILVFLVKTQTGAVLGGFLSAGILAAIMSSLDSQFLCIGTMFTTDVVNHYAPGKFNDRQQVWIARAFIIGIVILTYFLSLANLTSVFTLGVWCFSGFSALFPLVFACVYWKRLTTAGAYACVIAVATTWIGFFYHAYSTSATPNDFRAYSVKIGEYETMPVFWMVMASTVAMVVVSLVTRPLDEEHLARFFPKKNT
jgi:SSS family solute:Na+ symporter